MPKPKKEKKPKVVKTRNANTMTESAFFGFIRSGLRRQFRFWKPLVNAKIAARRSNESENKRLKWEFQCNHCKQWFPDKQVEVDHVVECGSLRCYADIGPFVERLTAEGPDAFQVLCIDCHSVKTMRAREARQLLNNDSSTNEKPADNAG